MTRPAPPARQRVATVAALAVVAAITWWASAGVGFSVAEIVNNVGNLRHLIDDSFPPSGASGRGSWSPSSRPSRSRSSAPSLED